MNDVSSPLGAPTGGRRRRSRRHQGWSRRSRILLGLLGVGGVAVFLLVLYFGVQLYALAQENERLRDNLDRSQRELERLRPELERLRTEFRSLVEGRIPGLRRLEYHRVIPLDEGYAKNIVFGIVKKNAAGTAYEFKIVLENTAPYLVWPRLTVFLFDGMGIQIGQSEVGDAGNPVADGRSLAPGEVVSHSGLITLDGDGVPAYFLVRLHRDSQDAAAPGLGDPPPPPADEPSP
ncbi:MAG: hypothetical protein M3Z21_06300 [Pseudomonadota bacterium]|nr:hypothetical protein [Pseudomonadota bacterium]